MATHSFGITMNKSLSLALLVIGVVLLVLGVVESDSISSDFSRLFTGEPTDKTVWLLIGGGVAAIVGLGGLARGSR
jgi:hypothetical protein